MPAQREDYLLQILEAMSEMLRRVTKLRETGHLNQALNLLIVAQEKLFARPAAEFTTRLIAEQLRLLALNESPENARAKSLLYASTLKEAGLIYQAHRKEAPALSAFQLALYVTLTVATDPTTPAGELDHKIEQLRTLIPEEALYGPIVELLAQLK